MTNPNPNCTKCYGTGLAAKRPEEWGDYLSTPGSKHIGACECVKQQRDIKPKKMVKKEIKERKAKKSKATLVSNIVITMAILWILTNS